QLEGYKYLKSFAMGYSFYRGKYTDALDKVIDVNKKSIIHIPNVNSGESTKDKYAEVDEILDLLTDGGSITQNEDGIYEIERPDGKELFVADLVNEEGREQVSAYLASITDDIADFDKLDVIIAFGMAKEGFDWPFAEYALTIGYRNSLTEVIQIIGRVTRDSSNKTHAQFTNLIAQPDAQDDEVLFAVNSIMKAISASLLMEQVLAPVYKFKPKDGKPDKAGDLSIRGLNSVDTTERTKKIIEDDMQDLKSSILQSQDIQNAIVSGADAKMINKTLIPRVIIERYSDLTNEELETIRQHTVADINIAAGSTTMSEDGSREIIKMADRFINIDELSIDLIDQVNPFQRAYEVISRDIDAPTLRFIQDYLSSNKYDFTEEQLVAAFKAAKKFQIENGRNPDRNSKDESEKYLAFALLRLAELKRERETAREEDE
ncbi:MAG: DNA helicase, partial [Lactococcus sp.]|nr:DNA helicase [Lactococcus sp.]